MASNPEHTFSSPAHKAHYEEQMNLALSKLKDVVFVLPTDSPHGDFAILRGSSHFWTTSAKNAWRDNKTPPIKLSDLPKAEKLATYTYHVPRLRRNDGDVRITKADFERLESAPKAAASIWQMMPEFLAVLPKPAIVFSEAMKKGYNDGTIKDESAPCIGDCLRAGYRPEDLFVSADGKPVLPGGGAVHAVRVGELLESLGGTA